LGRLREAHELLPFDVMLPAPGQGALAIQAVDGTEAAELAAGVDDRDTSRAVRAERLLLRSLGGGCLSAVGAYAVVAGDELVLDAVVLGDGGERVLRARARGVDDDEVVREVAARLEAGGSARLRDRGLHPALMPARFLAEELAEALAGAMAPRARILLARAAGARDVLPERLREAGARVDVLELYRAVPTPGLPQRLAENLD